MQLFQHVVCVRELMLYLIWFHWMRRCDGDWSGLGLDNCSPDHSSNPPRLAPKSARLFIAEHRRVFMHLDRGPVSQMGRLSDGVRCATLVKYGSKYRERKRNEMHSGCTVMHIITLFGSCNNGQR